MDSDVASSELPAMDLGQSEASGPLSFGPPPSAATPSEPPCPWDLAVPEAAPTSDLEGTGPKVLGSQNQMDLDEDPSGQELQHLVDQFQALPLDLPEAPSQNGHPCPLHIATGHGLTTPEASEHHGLLSSEARHEDLINLLCGEEGAPLTQTAPPTPEDPGPVPCLLQPPKDCAERTEEGSVDGEGSSSSSPEPWLDPGPLVHSEDPSADAGATQTSEALASYPTFQEVAGPCDPEDLLDGVIFGAKYLGSTQLVSERNPSPSARMAQAQEAVDRIKAPEGETQPMTEVDLFISTKRIKVLTADSQEAMMDHSLQTISYIADIGNVVVLMARRRLARQPGSQERRLYKMICHVFHSADAQLIAQAIGQAFGVAYGQFLRASGIDPSQLSTQEARGRPKEGDLHNGDLAHFSNQENCRDVCIEKQRGECLGVALVESGWGSLLPTAVIANLLHGGPAERSGLLSIGDRLTAVNGTSLVGLPLASCQAIVRELKSETSVTLSIVHCPPVTTAIIRRPHAREQLGFCVENGIICSLMRGGIAERGGVRVGHRIIEINGQSVVATPHDRIIQLLTQAHDEVHIKMMPASTYRLLTGQEQPVYL
ncbi:LOW QUALITY PROTEIN: amyloid-beta A4 precursor protein-binding family A member 3 [Antechinus flavipes]|uniref:LOW QUALITY PROTEIN: amyloid-beta A4 precursor protein-binding family A member 3 n=1 Tax=Antechinus flavipes TaxID=38775 RepID=UPI0022355D49|nr:LOW QUALITY PROTEIN: amyloid-beta A4 precursor protein-binding family A member 3 [Antechinus flavipes]